MSKEIKKGRYTVEQNQIARNVLMAYKKSRRYSWEDVIAEIADLIENERDTFEQQLTRQTMSYWQNAKGKMRDAAFDNIYRFLTHPKTQSRPEFRGAAMLNADYQWKHVARTLAPFIQKNLDTVYLRKIEIDIANSPYQKRHLLCLDHAYYEVTARKERTPKEGLRRLEGIYRIPGCAADDYLILTLDQAEPVLLANMVPAHHIDQYMSQKWDIGSQNGYCLLNDGFHLTLQCRAERTLQTMFLVPEIDHQTGIAKRLFAYRERHVFDEMRLISRREDYMTGETDRYYSLENCVQFQRSSLAETASVFERNQAA